MEHVCRCYDWNLLLQLCLRHFGENSPTPALHDFQHESFRNQEGCHGENQDNHYTILTDESGDLNALECVTNLLLRRMVVNIGGEAGAINCTKTPSGTLMANLTQREIDIVIFRKHLDNSQCLPWQDIHAFDLPYRSKRFVETLVKSCESFQSEQDLAGREEYTNYVRDYQSVITYYESCLRLSSSK